MMYTVCKVPVLVCRAEEVMYMRLHTCRLLCLLPVTLKVISANSVDPDQTAPLGAV